MFRMIEQGLARSEVSDVVLASRLIVRESTAPPSDSPTSR
jgi:hypothetical protein